MSEQPRQFAAESARIRAEFGRVRRTFGGRSAELAGNFLWRKFGGSARNRADSRESAAEGLLPSILPNRLRQKLEMVKRILIPHPLDLSPPCPDLSVRIPL